MQQGQLADNYPAAFPLPMRASGMAGSRKRFTSIASDSMWIILLIGMTLSEATAFTSEPSRPFWFAAYLIAAHFAITRPNELFVAMQRNVVLMLWPALAALSAIWSPSPVTDLYNSMQLMMTVLIGFVLVLEHGRSKTLYILFLVFLAADLLSIAYYFVYPTEAMGWTDEFRGFYHHKNELGGYSALLMLASISLLLGGNKRLLAAFGFALGSMVLLLTRSGTAAVGAAAALSFVPSILLYRKRASAMWFAIGLQLVIFAPIAAYILLGHVDVFDLALGSIGKDPTLTGRTVLWGFATDAIAHSPYIGYGYKGWWDESNPAVFFLRYVIGQDLWFFHNVYLEVTVAFGIFGAALLVATFVVAYRRAFGSFWTNPDSASIWGLLFLVFITIYCTAENTLFVNHSSHHLILATLFASNMRPKRRRFKGGNQDTRQSDGGVLLAR